ncbi:WecB/TagA/CpsF family glycosyltransferase [Nesterenkonia sp. YGD6]|uniref:WecB/TagA/CpsF family glycosyltransferase n=1 Tax=Nesterenkonia sp. YGD6 TaxID=2901231 RepID=UPI00406C8F51
MLLVAWKRISMAPDLAPKTVVLGGLPTVQTTRRQLAQLMVRDAAVNHDSEGRVPPKLVFSSNGQGLALTWNNDRFRAAMMKADWIHADGMPVVLASHLTRTVLPERVSTTDFFHDAAEAATAAGLSFYMLGGSEKQNSDVVAAVRHQYPSLRIAGAHHGYFEDEDSVTVCADIRASGADVLWVGLGKPRQEYWSVMNQELLGGVTWVKTCGGLYSFLTGDSPRAPKWMQAASLEWLFRASQDPKRLLGRYLVTNPIAMYRLVRHTDSGLFNQGRLRRNELESATERPHFRTPGAV